MRQLKVFTVLPRWPIYLLGLLPAAFYFERALSNKLGADPLAVLENALGEWALIFLVVGLTITPIVRLAKVNFVKFRRPIGLVAFTYVALHLTVYLVLDRQLDFWEIWTDVVKRPYITIGATAFLLLIPLALTSTNRSIQKLGVSSWRKLHMLVYPAALFGALHYLLLVKTWMLEPIVYLFLVINLLSMRLIWLHRRRANAATKRTSKHAISSTLSTHNKTSDR